MAMKSNKLDPFKAGTKSDKSSSTEKHDKVEKTARLEKSMVKDKEAISNHYRGSIRFTPDSGRFALIDLEVASAKNPFKPTVVALIVNESYRGCALVIIGSSRLVEGTRCRVQVGDLAPMMAEVKWRKTVDEDISRIGLNYAE